MADLERMAQRSGRLGRDAGPPVDALVVAGCEGRRGIHVLRQRFQKGADRFGVEGEVRR